MTRPRGPPGQGRPRMPPASTDSAGSVTYRPSERDSGRNDWIRGRGVPSRGPGPTAQSRLPASRLALPGVFAGKGFVMRVIEFACAECGRLSIWVDTLRFAGIFGVCRRTVHYLIERGIVHTWKPSGSASSAFARSAGAGEAKRRASTAGAESCANPCKGMQSSAGPALAPIAAGRTDSHG
jgi:hypothetical protein